MVNNIILRLIHFLKCHKKNLFILYYKKNQNCELTKVILKNIYFHVEAKITAINIILFIIF